VPERDDHELAWALLNAVEDPHFLSQIARNGAEVVREKFDLRVQARRLEDIYLRMIGSGD
jgi:glycosyltransferase involved in cell wall biosynthesis